MNLFVSFAGNIGCGKTTAAQTLSQLCDLPVYYEPVLENRFLTDYYTDMGRWAFTLQMEFLLKRCHDHERHEGNLSRGCVQDRSLIEDPEIFAQYLHELGHMTKNELSLYLDYFHRAVAQLRMPDLIILLHTDNISLIMDRIRMRGREAEKSIDVKFLEGLNRYYSTFKKTVTERYQIPVISIDIEEVDLQSSEGKAYLEARVREYSNG